MTDVTWKPGKNPDQAAMDRLTKFSSRPSHQLPSPYMRYSRPGHPAYFNELSEHPVAELSYSVLNEVLSEIASNHFESQVDEATTDWFNYLLPDLLDRSNQADSDCYLIEAIIAASIAVNTANARTLYPHHKKDLVQTIGRVIMGPQFWNAQERLNDEFVRSNLDWWESYALCAAPISASIYFHLYFLEAAEIALWVRSLLAIEDVLWQANVLAWIATASRISWLDPFKLAKDDKSFPLIYFDNCNILQQRKILIRKENIDVFFDAIREGLRLESLLTRAEQFSIYPDVDYWFRTARICDEIADNILV